MVTPPEDVIKRIKRDAKAVQDARTRIAPLGDFVDGFDWPVGSRISGVLAVSEFSTANRGRRITALISPRQRERLFWPRPVAV